MLDERFRECGHAGSNNFIDHALTRAMAPSPEGQLDLFCGVVSWDHELLMAATECLSGRRKYVR
jgi:hypothetical protein